MRSRFGPGALLLTVLIWGSTFVVTKQALDGFGALQLTVARFVIALAVLALPARRRGFSWRMCVRGVYPRFGLSGVALFFGLQNLGLLFTTAASASLIHASTPAVIAVASILLLGERLERVQYVGLGLAVAGATLVALSGASADAGAAPLLGNLLVVGSVIAWAMYTVDGRRLAAEADPLVSTTASIGAGLLFLVPLAAVETALQGAPRPGAAGVVAVAYLGVAASAGTLFLWNYALRDVPASVAAGFINLVPVVGTALAVAAGEPLSPQQAVGGALALAGVWLGSRRVHRASARPPAVVRRRDR